MRTFLFPEKQVFVSSFLTSSEGIQPAMKDVSVEAIKTHIVRHTGRITDRLQLAASLHDEWRKYARCAFVLPVSWTIVRGCCVLILEASVSILCSNICIHVHTYIHMYAHTYTYMYILSYVICRGLRL